MLNKIKIALLAVAAGAMTLSARAQVALTPYNGDLLIGFTAQYGNDLVYDLGQPSALTNGKTWNLGPLLASFDLSSVNWGVIGDQKISTTGYVWTTTPVDDLAPNNLDGFSAWSPLHTCSKSIYQSFTNAGAGNYLFVDSTIENSWNQQTISGSDKNKYVNAYNNPNVVGLTADSFYYVIATNSPATLIGSFSLAANGVVTYNVASSNPPAPKIVNVTRTGGTTTVFFTTVAGSYTYSLYYTNSAGLGALAANWPKSPTTLIGNGNTNSLSDTTTDAIRFYRVGVQ